MSRSIAAVCGAESAGESEEALRIAEQLDDAGRLVGAHMAVGVVLFWQGKLKSALEHLRRG
jgi:hypothetical protein